MALNNSHRALGRARTPLLPAGRAAAGAGGAAVLGSVLLGTAFTGGAAHANDLALMEDSSSSQSTSAEQAPAAEAASTSAETSAETLRRGDSGASVEQLQSALNDRGADLPVTGFFGSMTEDAVQDVQSSAGIAVDGVVGADTRAALEGGSGSVDSGSEATISTTSAPAGSAAVSTASTSTSGNAIVDTARTALGTPYSWGGSSLSGMDCSGLVAYSYGQAGIDVPRTSSQQAAAGQSISQSELQPGDLVVWPGHIAIYSGDGKIIDASGSKQQVVEREIWGNPTDFVTYR
ncbi:C40 family peptidase [Brachybacterium paraconglomeratum]|uniref:C40 family peptidase n=1 Tax=Brachybacterium paraconglomeratum TaxID=173362 RepID=UPI00381E5411